MFVKVNEMTLDELVAEARSRDLSLGKSPKRRIEYLRNHGLIDKPRVTSEGRGEGITSVYPAETLLRLVAIDALLKEGFSVRALDRGKVDGRLRKMKRSGDPKVPERFRRQWVDAMAKSSAAPDELRGVLDEVSAQMWFPRRQQKPLPLQLSLNELGGVARTMRVIAEACDHDGKARLLENLEKDLRGRLDAIIDSCRAADSGRSPTPRAR